MRKDDTSDESADRASSRALQLMRRIESVGNGWLRQHYVRELGEVLVEGVCECEDVKDVIDEIVDGVVGDEVVGEDKVGDKNRVDEDRVDEDRAGDKNRVDEDRVDKNKMSKEERTKKVRIGRERKSIKQENMKSSAKNNVKGSTTSSAKGSVKKDNKSTNAIGTNPTAKSINGISPNDTAKSTTANGTNPLNPTANHNPINPLTLNNINHAKQITPSPNKVLLTFLKLIHTLTKDPKQEKRTCAHLLSHHIPHLIKIKTPSFTIHKPTDSPLFSTDQHNYHVVEQLSIADQKRMIRKTLGMETDMVRKDIVVENDIRMDRVEVVGRRKRVEVIGRRKRVEVIGRRKRVERRVEDVCTFFECLEDGMVEMDWKEREGCFLVYCGIFEGMGGITCAYDDGRSYGDDKNGSNAKSYGNDKDGKDYGKDKSYGKDYGKDSTNHKVSPTTNPITNPNLTTDPLTLSSTNPNLITRTLPYTHTISSSLLQTTINILYNDKFSDYQSDRTSLPVRQAAAHLLSFIYQKDVLDQLFMFLDHPDWEVQCSALLALKSVQHRLSSTDKKDVALCLLTLLESEDEDVKCMAADMLVHFKGVVGDVRVKMVVDEGVSRLGVVRMMECYCVRVGEGLSVDGCFRSEMVELRIAVLEYLRTMFRKGLVYDCHREDEGVVGDEDSCREDEVSCREGIVKDSNRKGIVKGKDSINTNTSTNPNSSNPILPNPTNIIIHHHYVHFINLLIQNILIEETPSLTFLTFNILPYYPINHVLSYVPLVLKPLNYVFKNTDFKNSLEMIDNAFSKGGVESMGRERVLVMRMRYFMYFCYLGVFKGTGKECKDEDDIIRWSYRVNDDEGSKGRDRDNDDGSEGRDNDGNEDIDRSSKDKSSNDGNEDKVIIDIVNDDKVIINGSKDNTSNLINTLSCVSAALRTIPLPTLPLPPIQSFLLSILYKTLYLPSNVPYTAPQIKQSEWNEKLRYPARQSVFHVVNEHFLDVLRCACFNGEGFYREWLVVEENDGVIWWYVYFLVRDGKELCYDDRSFEDSRGISIVDGEEGSNDKNKDSRGDKDKVKDKNKDSIKNKDKTTLKTTPTPKTAPTKTNNSPNINTLHKLRMSLLIPSIIHHANPSFQHAFFKHLNTSFYRIKNYRSILLNTCIPVLAIIAQHIHLERIVCDRIVDALYGDEQVEYVVRLVDLYMPSTYGERIVGAVMRRELTVRVVGVLGRVRFNEWLVLLVRPLLRFISLKDIDGVIEDRVVERVGEGRVVEDRDGVDKDRMVEDNDAGRVSTKGKDKNSNPLTLTPTKDSNPNLGPTTNLNSNTIDIPQRVTAGYKLFSNIVPFIQTVRSTHPRITHELSVLSVLTNSKKLPKIAIHSRVTLRKYQVKGVYWLNFLYLFGINGILADEMGLGKTVQVLVFLFSKIDEIKGKDCCRGEDNDKDCDIDRGSDKGNDKDKDYNAKGKGNVNNINNNPSITTLDLNPTLNTIPDLNTTPDHNHTLNHKILIVCPGSLTGHWQNEIKKITNVYEGHIYTKKDNVLSFITIISYDTYRHAHRAFTDHTFFYLILDEGHILRNVDTALYHKISALRALNKLILSGTPVQNSINDLFALFNLLMPCYLGDKNELKERERRIRKGKDRNCGEEDVRMMEKELRMVRRRVGPFVLRRCKKDVMVDLPDKIVKDLVVVMGDEQREVYEWLLRDGFVGDCVVEKGAVEKGAVEEETVEEGAVRDCSHGEGVEKGVKRRGRTNNASSNASNNSPANNTPTNKRLKTAQTAQTAQNATLGAHVDSAVSYKNINSFKKAKDLIKCCSSASYIREDVNQSCKIDALKDLYGTLNRTDSRILIFCQLRRSIRLIIDELALKDYLILDGQTRDKSGVVRRFMAGDYKTLLLTTSTGSLGLNLCIADTVIFFEHDYNPFNDLQAMDRAHRIGQRRTVSVYRLIVKDTVEERIMNLQEFKKFVAGSVIKKGTGEFGGDVSGESGVEGIY